MASNRERDLTAGEAFRTLRSAQKSGRGAPAYSRWVNRRAGRLLAAGAYRLGLTPNQVTAVSAGFTFTGIGFLAVEPSTVASVLVATLLLMGYALDSADGQLARLTGLGGPSGEWLDHVVDMGKICLLHGMVAFSWVRWGATGLDLGVWEVLVPVLFLTVAVVSFFGWLLADLLTRLTRARPGSSSEADPTGSPVQGGSPVMPAEAGRDPATVAPALRSILRLPSDYGLLALTFLWFATAAFPTTYLLLLAANVLILVAALPTWFRQVRECQVQT